MAFGEASWASIPPCPSEIVPWRAHRDDICRLDEEGPLVEIPIYCENRRLWHFVTLNRIYRVVLHRLNPLPKESRHLTEGDADTGQHEEGGLLRRLATKSWAGMPGRPTSTSVRAPS